MSRWLVGEKHNMVLGPLDVLVWLFWFLLGAYGVWFFTKAKQSQPLTLDELVILWKLHTQQTGCDTPLSKLNLIRRQQGKEIVGFECECGYRYMSQRLITQRVIPHPSMFSSPRRDGESQEVESICPQVSTEFRGQT
jgi:hypothetical protein